MSIGETPLKLEDLCPPFPDPDSSISHSLVSSPMIHWNWSCKSHFLVLLEFCILCMNNALRKKTPNDSHLNVLEGKHFGQSGGSVWLSRPQFPYLWKMRGSRPPLSSGPALREEGLINSWLSVHPTQSALPRRELWNWFWGAGPKSNKFEVDSVWSILKS